MTKESKTTLKRRQELASGLSREAGLAYTAGNARVILDIAAWLLTEQRNNSEVEKMLDRLEFTPASYTPDVQVEIYPHHVPAVTREIAALRYAVADLEAQHSREYFRARELETAIESAIEMRDKQHGAHAAICEVAACMVRELRKPPRCNLCRDKKDHCVACGRGLEKA